MIIITAAWAAKPGKEKELKLHLENMVDQVRKNEPDCLLYTLHQGFDDKTKFFFYEQFTDMNAVEWHKNTAYLKSLRANTETLIAKPVQVELLEMLK
ncbi:MAG: putative quinol monooxygenase [Deltaproteobacteria bacterium]|nr:putative quinol monooxygenase [Deltaproteobacteria bacterium]